MVANQCCNLAIIVCWLQKVQEIKHEKYGNEIPLPFQRTYRNYSDNLNQIICIFSLNESNLNLTYSHAASITMQ